MSTPRFYQQQLLSPGALVTLDQRVSHHVINVLRLKKDDTLLLFDGSGKDFLVVITDVRKRVCIVKVESFAAIDLESPLKIHLLQGVSRTDRMDYALQKSVELGVTDVYPIHCDHSSVNVRGERGEKKLHHWRGVLISACEQCKRTILPTLHSVQSFAQWLGNQHSASASTATVNAKEHENELRIVLDPNSESTLKKIADDSGKITSSVRTVYVFIGPEGGISARELELATQFGFTGIRLGPRILRTETATIAVLSQLQMLWGDLG